MDLPADAPELDISEWVNADPLDLAALRGRIVLIEAFQMLCPACVHHSLPQAQRIQRHYSSQDLVVLGLHTVFEHHDVMGPAALKVFVAENRLTFPIGIDRHDTEDRIPSTMRRYALQGTPSQILLDRQGCIRSSAFGTEDDLTLGTRIGRLLAERPPSDDGHRISGLVGDAAGSG